MSRALKRSRTDVITVILYFFLVLTGLLMIDSVGAPPGGYDMSFSERLMTPVG